MNPPDVRFAVDAMSQSLAKWIRLLGYDCAASDDLFGRRAHTGKAARARSTAQSVFLPAISAAA
jgi:uncharacterized protein with PIN domain